MFTERDYDIVLLGKGDIACLVKMDGVYKCKVERDVSVGILIIKE